MGLEELVSHVHNDWYNPRKRWPGLHAGTVALIVSYYNVSPEASEEFGAEPILHLLTPGHGIAGRAASSLRLGPINLEYLCDALDSARRNWRVRQTSPG